VLSPECRRIVDESRRRPTPDFSTLNGAAAAGYAAELRRNFPVPTASAGVGVRVCDRDLGDVNARIYQPRGARHGLPVVVFLHGGGWVAGSPRAYDRLCSDLAALANCVVVGVTYRLAPEHRYPAALDDAYAVTCWTHEHAASLRGDRNRLFVMGVSAGGNLAAAVALRARDENGPPIRGQLLLYPVLDDMMSSDSHRRNGQGFVTTHAQVGWFWRQYAPDPAIRTSPYASPLRADDLGGLPPAALLGAEYDPLRDEAEAYAAALRAAGTPATFSEYRGQIHGFVSLAPDSPSAQGALSELIGALSGWTEPASDRAASKP
jgi:acetyl esterase